MENLTDRRPAFSYRKHPHLYEINTWAWLKQLSERRGRRVTLGDAPDEEWDRLRELGFDFAWLMGIWKRSAEGRRIFQTDPASFPVYDEALPGWKMSDVVGSAYSIEEYTPEPRLATWDEVDLVRDKLHSRGLGLILDFVPNHTGLDHPWLQSHPEYYVQGTQDDFRRNPSAFYLVELATEGGQPSTTTALHQAVFVARGKDPYFPAWPDVAQLNYLQPATRGAMVRELTKIAQHCDGVRCDMAMLLLNDVFARTWGPLLSGPEYPPQEFWADAVALVPAFVWIAEVYWDLEWQMQQLGFTFTYDKRLYDRLRGGSALGVTLHLNADLAYQGKSVRFLENHDEPRAAVMFGKERLQAVGTLVATLPGMRFYHQGQLEGRKLRLPVQLSGTANEPIDPEFLAFYEKILRITKEDTFHDGEWRLLEPGPAGDSSSENLIAYQWRFADAWKLVVVNLSQSPAQGFLSLGGEVDASKQYTFRDQLNDTTYEHGGRDLVQKGLFVRLGGYGSHLFSISRH